MTDDLRKDRAMGAIMGTLIGDALGMGCHWYYDIEAQVRDYGDWISDYHDCKPERKDVHGKVATLRYELGVRAGDVSQTGQFVVMLMESIAEKGTYDEADYSARLDEFLKTIDGTPFSGRYTDRAIVDVWNNRKAGIPWSDAGSMTDTPEAAIRAVVIAARSSGDPVALAIEGESNIHLTHKNPYITGSSLAYAMATEAFIQGVPLSGIRKYMSALKDNPETRDRTCSNDVRFQVGNEGAVLGSDLSLNLDPVIVTRLFGMNCVLGFMLPRDILPHPPLSRRLRDGSTDGRQCRWQQHGSSRNSRWNLRRDGWPQGHPGAVHYRAQGSREITGSCRESGRSGRSSGRKSGCLKQTSFVGGSFASPLWRGCKVPPNLAPAVI